MPMHRWMASAAGGSNQRLKPGPAIVRSFDSQPPEEGAASEPFMTVDILILFMTFEHRSPLSQHRRLPDCKYPVGNVSICGRALNTNPKDRPLPIPHFDIEALGFRR